MNARVWICAICIILAGVGPANSQSKIQEYADKFSRATSEREKLLICIDIIDDGLICRSASVKTVDQIFGSDWAKVLPDKDEPHFAGVINFGKEYPNIVGADGKVSAGYFDGWCLAFEFGSDGKIRTYHLTNVRK